MAPPNVISPHNSLPYLSYLTTITFQYNISLTSCNGKLYERMLAEIIYFLVESRSILSPFQAGYRKMRGCEDQIARTIQEMEDRFQCPKMERSVLVLLGFSKAFNTVWREKLLLSLNDMGIPVQILQWLREFLRNRTAKVRFNGTLSRSVPMHQGVPLRKDPSYRHCCSFCTSMTWRPNCLRATFTPCLPMMLPS